MLKLVSFFSNDKHRKSGFSSPNMGFALKLFSFSYSHVFLSGPRIKKKKNQKQDYNLCCTLRFVGRREHNLINGLLLWRANRKKQGNHRLPVWGHYNAMGASVSQIGPGLFCQVLFLLLHPEIPLLPRGARKINDLPLWGGLTSHFNPEQRLV